MYVDTVWVGMLQRAAQLKFLLAKLEICQNIKNMNMNTKYARDAGSEKEKKKRSGQQGL
jgi:hypothetical protein